MTVRYDSGRTVVGTDVVSTQWQKAADTVLKCLVYLEAPSN